MNVLREVGKSTATKVNVNMLTFFRGKWQKVAAVVIMTSCFIFMTSSGEIDSLYKYMYRSNEYYTKALEDRPPYSQCIERHVVLAKYPLPVTALASFPGSGNTWTRHLIQQLTGIATSSEYCDEELLHFGFPFECVKDKSLAIATKTHETNFQFYERAALLIRDPYESILTYLKYSAVGHKNDTDMSVIQKIANEKFDEYLQRYIDFNKAWLLTFSGDVHLIQYKNLRKDMTSELRTLGHFLNVDVTDYDVSCTVRLQQGKYRRKAKNDKIDEMKAIYTKTMIKQLQNAQKQVTEYVKQRLGQQIDLGQETSVALET